MAEEEGRTGVVVHRLPPCGVGEGPDVVLARSAAVERIHALAWPSGPV